MDPITIFSQLTETEAVSLFCFTVIKTNDFDDKVSPANLKQKRNIRKKTGIKQHKSHFCIYNKTFGSEDGIGPTLIDSYIF